MSDQIEALREALRHSPDNLPLLLHLAQTLASSGRLDEAEEAYDAGRQRHGDDPRLLCGLAEVYLRSGRVSHAVVMLEGLTARGDAPAAAHGLLARAAIAEGKRREAEGHYRRARDADPAYRDERLDAAIGSDESPQLEWEEDEDDEDFLGGRERVRAGDQAGSFEPETEKPKLGFDAVMWEQVEPR